MKNPDRSNTVAPARSFETMSEDEYRRQRLLETAPWELERISEAAWIARERRDLCSLVVPPPVERYLPFGYMKDRLPQDPGVYFLQDTEGGVLYVGKASWLYDRIKAHSDDRRIPFWGVTWRHMPVLAAVVLEAYFIGELRPPYNRKFDGQMRQWHREMADALAG